MKTSRLFFSLVAGVVAGAAAGALLGVLYAPDKGTETRKKIGQKGDELRDTLKEKFEGAKHQANDLLEKGKSKIYEAKNDVTSSF